MLELDCCHRDQELLPCELLELYSFHFDQGSLSVAGAGCVRSGASGGHDMTENANAIMIDQNAGNDEKLV